MSIFTMNYLPIESCIIITLVCGFRCNVGDSNGTGLNDFRSGVGDAIGVQIGGAGGCGGLLSLSPFKESCEPQTPLTTNNFHYNKIIDLFEFNFDAINHTRTIIYLFKRY